MKYMILVLAVSGATAHAACEDMYFWAQLLQPGRCTPRTEFEKREIAFRESMEVRQQRNNEIRRNAEMELTRRALAKTYGVGDEAVTVSGQRTQDGFGVYYVNNGQIVCQNTRGYGLGCVDTGGHYAKTISAAQQNEIYARSWEARIEEDGTLTPSTPPRKRDHRRGRNVTH